MIADWLRANNWRSLAVSIAAGIALLLSTVMALPLAELHSFYSLDRMVTDHPPATTPSSVGLAFSAAHMCPSAVRASADLTNVVRSASIDHQVQVQTLEISEPHIDAVQFREAPVEIAAVGSESELMGFLSQIVRGAPALFFDKVSFVSGGAGVTLVVDGRLLCEGG